jgi:small redox-active disulfide protein 2
MLVKILGSGCKKCKALAQNVEAAAKAASQEVEIEKVTDIVEISRFGVMSTPGLVIDDKVISTGKVLSVMQITELL